jgi:4'-phosphopantetheinyl transferase
MKVHWLEQTEADLPANLDWLSASEAACLTALRIPKRRGDWQLGRWTAKCALSAYLSMPDNLQSLSDIEIRPAPSGVPEAFVGGQPAPVSVSLSHSNGTALCAIAPFGAALGCDLELVEPRSNAFVADYFTAEEQALTAQAYAAERSRFVTLLWSAKESALKALHDGLRQDTRSVAVSLPESPPTADDESCSAQPELILLQSRSVWHGLEVRNVDGAVFHGWWQQRGNLLRTLVAAPRPMTPIPLAMHRPNWLGLTQS